MSEINKNSNDSEWYKENLQKTKTYVNDSISDAKAKQNLSTRCLLYPRFIKDCKDFFIAEGYDVSEEYESDFDCSYSYIVISWMK